MQTIDSVPPGIGHAPSPSANDDHLGLGSLVLDLARATRRHSGRRSIGTGALIVAGAALESFRLLLLVPIIDIFAGRMSVHGLAAGMLRGLAAAGLTGTTAQLGALLALFAVASALRSVVGYRSDIGMVRLDAELVTAERLRLIRRVSSAPWHRIATLDHARVTNIVSVEAPRLGSSAQLLVQAATNVMLLLAQLAIAFVLAPGLALFVLTASIAIGAVLFKTQRRTIERGRRHARANETMLATTARLLAGLKVALAQDAQAGFVEDFDAAQGNVRALQLEVAVARGRRTLIVGTLSTLLFAVVVLVAYDVFAVRIAVLLTTMYTLVRMAGPATRIFRAGQTLAFALPGYRLIARLEADLGTAAEEDDVAPVPLPPGAVALRGARYLHPGGGGIDAADIAFAPGEFVGIAGPSGHGKTTLLDMVAALLDPQTGMLIVGGAPVTGTALRRGWQRTVGYVAQDPFIFNDTLRRNLNWATDGHDDATLLAAARLVGADVPIARLGGLDAAVGERGALLSGGERQRIAIARALLRRPRLLILDEATSGIDAASEAALLNRLASLPDRPTILLVSHRAESLRRCDRVIEIRDGRLVAPPAPVTVR